MNYAEEAIDTQSFEAALTALTSLNNVSAIQQAAKEMFNADISIAYSRLEGFKHTIYFMVHLQNNVSFASLNDLTSRLQHILSYDEVVVYTETSLSEATFASDYSFFIRIYPENIEGIHNFVAKWLKTLKGNQSDSYSQTYDDFVRHLRESDDGEKAKILGQLTEDCHELGIDLNFDFKRPRLQNK